MQRAGSALLAGWIAAAALGFSGPGPCSARERHSPDAALAFEAVVHQDAPTRWRIRSASGIERLVLEGAQAMELQELRPSASREARADGARVFRFRGAAPKHVEIEVVPRGAGWSRGRLQLAGGEELAFEQLVLP